DGATRVFGTVAASTSGERGLLGLAVSPRFATDRSVYTFHSARNGTTQEVVRWIDCAGEGRNPEVIVELPAGSTCCHKGGKLAFAPDGRLFFTERAGTIKVVQDGATRVFGTVAASTSGERGLLGLAVSPRFATDRSVYTFHSARNGTTQEVVRWTDCAGEGRNPEVIVELPAGSTCCHKGGKLAFGPDGKLYVTLGDQHVPTSAADTSDVRGKLLRYNPDGSIPADNPFGNAVWASGLRNPFGLAISPTGRIAVTVNGPSGDAGSPSTGFDIVYSNVTRGFAGQWPACYGYSRPLRGATCTGNEPDWSSEAGAPVPTGAAFVNASGPARYAGKLVFCTLNAGMKVLTDGSPHATVADGDPNCRLDVVQGPDNAVYVADTDAIHRVS
ncbi:MAG: PQQ-dependent sugar dehydrogenase, partial [Actinomycetota bacterium]|nr:PQQ-dependent sugar dehydrogenase [Actinomycetota bacterium]